MVPDSDLQNSIEDFIRYQVVSRGLDERTRKAYRLDLELFFRWLREREGRDGEDNKRGDSEENRKERKDTKGKENNEKKEDNENNEGIKKNENNEKNKDKEKNEDNEKKENRKIKDGFSDKSTPYIWEEKMEEYLEYISKEKGRRFSTVCRKHLVFGYYLSYLKSVGRISRFREPALPKQLPEVSAGTFLTKGEVDAFFQAIDREYTELDSDFRKRVCLRDQVMMKLLFYHRIEISELLRMEIFDYNRKTAVLAIRRKRERGCSVYLYSRNLQKQMGQWLDEHGYFEHGGLYDNRMFLSKLGKPLSMKMVTNIFDKYRVLAGIEKECTPKDLKNSLGRYGEEMVRERG